MIFKSKKTEMRVYGPVEWVICGLGNPEKKYQGTRHNVGFCCVERIANDLGVSFDKVKFKSACAEAMIAGKRALIIKPSTYMNLSGEAVQEALAYHKLSTKNLIVFYDDTSLPVGKMRIRLKGSAGGHNGIKNIIYLTGSDEFARIKVGIGEKPNPDYDLADWVLSKISKEEVKEMDKLLPELLNITELIMEGKSQDAMNRYN